MQIKSASLILALSLFSIHHASALEGALGRPISGSTIMPYAGLVPPAPGFILSVAETYYQGDIGGSGTVPVGVNLALDLDLSVSFTPISLVYIWDTHSTCWNFASGITLPIAWLEAEADVAIGPITGKRKEKVSGLFDIMITPIVASYHISKTEHIAFGLSIWAPTGDYDSDDLANLGLNNWTFIPSVSFTKIFPEANIELSATWGVEFYTENNDTDYENGIVSDLEVLAIKRFKNGLGVGVTGSWIEQLTDDEGGAADLLNGFQGRAFGVGPIATYSTKIGEQPLDLNARWVHEFGNENRFEGDLFMLSASFKF